MQKLRLATMWLDGCSGCHMSLLDVDEGIITIAQKADVVYSPLVDQREYPHDVDIAIVEGAVSSNEDLEKIRLVRERTRIVVALGDCAITTNVTGMQSHITKPLPSLKYSLWTLFFALFSFIWSILTVNHSLMIIPNHLQIPVNSYPILTTPMTLISIPICF